MGLEGVWMGAVPGGFVAEGAVAGWWHRRMPLREGILEQVAESSLRRGVFGAEVEIPSWGVGHGTFDNKAPGVYFYKTLGCFGLFSRCVSCAS